MPLIDMPVEKLYEYHGSSPCPADFDQYWDESLEEMHALDPKLELVPSKFQTPQAECFDMFFTGVGGARIHAKYARPRGAAPHSCPAVVLLHGYTGDCGDWSSKLSFVSAGFSVTAIDARGQGGISEDVGGVVGNTYCGHIIRGLSDESPKKLLFRQIYLDCAQLAGITIGLPEVDPSRVAAHGGSQGGGLTIATAALEPRIARATIEFPFLTDYKRVWDMDLDMRAYAELRTYFRYYDPRHERENEIFERLGYIDVQYLAPRIKAKLIMGTGLMDDVCPPSTQFAAYNRMTCERKVVLYPDFGHEGLPDFVDMTITFFLEM